MISLAHTMVAGLSLTRDPNVHSYSSSEHTDFVRGICELTGSLEGTLGFVSAGWDGKVVPHSASVPH